MQQLQTFPHTEAGHTVVNVTQEQLLLHLALYQEQTADLKEIKDAVYKLLEKVGFINPDGTFRDTINMKMMMDVAMKAAMGNDKFKKDMAFVADLLPIILKYKDL